MPAAVDHAPTEDELRRMLMKSKLETSRKDLIENLFDFSKRTVKEVAVPRAQVVHFDLQRPFRRTWTWPAPAPTPGSRWWTATWTTWWASSTSRISCGP